MSMCAAHISDLCVQQDQVFDSCVATAGHQTPAWLLRVYADEWLWHIMTQAHVTIETRNGIRGTYAAKSLQPGDVIARIPMKAAIWCVCGSAMCNHYIVM